MESKTTDDQTKKLKFKNLRLIIVDKHNSKVKRLFSDLASVKKRVENVPISVDIYGACE